MKKAILTLILIFLAISLCGCNNKTSKAYIEFNNQLENVESTVSSTNSSEISDVSPAIIYDTPSLSKVSYYKSLSYNNMNREEEIRQQILSLNGYLKTNNSSLKLSNAQINALKNITSNLKKFTKRLKDSKADIKSTVSSIKKDSKNSKNEIKIESDYMVLNNNLDERYVCMLNIYNNLNFAYDILCEKTTTFDQPIIKLDKVENSKEIDTKEDEKEEKTFKKNIDSYNPYYKIEKENKTYPYQTMMPGNPYMNNGYYGNNRMFGRYGMNNYNMYGGYGYGYGYGFNPSRNTDTFYPYGRNIDTYRFAPNPNGLNNEYYPVWKDEVAEDDDIELLENCENCKEDKTVA